MIIPNKILTAEYAKELRELIKKYKIINIRDYSKISVFDVAVYPVVIIIKKEAPNGNHEIRADIVKDANDERATIKNLNYQNELNQNNSWSTLLQGSNELKFFDEIIEKYKQIGDIFNVHGAATVSEAYEIKKIIKEQDNKDSYLKLINTGTIDRYISLWGIKKTNYIKDSYLNPVVSERELKQIYPKRFEDSLKEKVIIAGMNKQLECFLDKGEYLAGKSTTILESEEKNGINSKFILAVLNSKLLTEIYKYIFGSLSLQGGYLQIGSPQIKKLPFAIPDKGQAGDLTSLASKMIKLNVEFQLIPENSDKWNSIKAEIEKTDKEIDQKVYELYGLTEDEIRIIEQKNA